MAKEDTSAGLLSKVVKFVRNPATSWTELDAKETDRDEAVSKLLLKEMIERKRRNDFIRKREFDMLRKMRKREAMGGFDAGERPSFFQSSMPSKPDDRARTIKKIDEIEAQMSMQWWKTKHGTDSSLLSVDSSNSKPGLTALPTAQSLAAPVRLAEISGPAAGYAATEPAGLQSLPTQSAPPSVDFRALVSMDGIVKPEAVKPPQAPVTSAMNAMATSARSADAGSLNFSYSNMMAIDVQEVAHDAELEEASISYANGDDAAAEATLLEMLAPSGSRTGQSEVWMALFDLYRATDSQEKFENAAIRFVQKFDRSAPQWFSMPEIVRQLGEPAAMVPSGVRIADWICASTMGIQTVAALKAALAKAPMPWCLNWTNLKTIDPNAVEPLYRVFAAWSSQSVKLRFIGDSHLHHILQKATPSGDRSTRQEWWQLRMEALRVTHRPDEFELAALDFCVTYEVSPPSWEVARCEYKPMDANGLAIAGNTIIGDVYRDSIISSLSAFDGDTQRDALTPQMSQLLSVELSGYIEGDAVAMLEKLETKLMGADIMMISCAKLIRVDFSAAGTLLNWVSARQAENRTVHFLDVHRLVAAFFNVIGITEHAKVSTRRD